MSDKIGDILFFLTPRVKELAFDNNLDFLKRLLFDFQRLSKDKEVSELIYDTIKYSGLTIPKNINTSRFNIEDFFEVIDKNQKPTSCKEKLANEIGVHKQTLNKWLKIYNPELSEKLIKKRKLTLLEIYNINKSLGFLNSDKIFTRKELAVHYGMSVGEFKKTLPHNLKRMYFKTIKYPPVFTNQIMMHLDG